MGSSVVVTYRILSRLPLEIAAQAIADEQTTGTFTRVPGETDELRDRHHARLLDIVEDEQDGAHDPLPGATGDGPVRSATVRIAFPLANSGPSLARILPIVAGNLYELRELAGLKVLDIDLPVEFEQAYPPAPFGVTGTRELMSRPAGILVGTIVKPNIGLGPQEYGKVVHELGLAGVDFIKDDEVNADCPPAPLRERAPRIVAALDAVEAETGRRPLYAFNISDEPDRMAELYDLVVDAGARCVMVNVHAVGLAATAALRRRATVPVHGHLASFGALDRHPHIGMGFVAFQKLARLAGVDHLHVGGFQSKFHLTDDEVDERVRAVRSPLLGGRECLPVLSSAQWAGTAPVTHRRTGTTDALVLAGGGVLGHPGGLAAGVRSMRQAWDATVTGRPLEDAAAENRELAEALRHFGAIAR